MTYDIYAIYKEGSYKVAESTHADHGMDLAARTCNQINQWPMAITAIIRGEHCIKGNLFTLDQLKNRKEA
jgi:hypothetical protein